MGVHYPADHELFAIVCIDDHNANAGFWRKNPKLLQQVRDKLQKYSSHWPEFMATAEDPKTLITMLELEQKLGREIKWVRGIGFDHLIELKKALPNISMRWCTEFMKIIPIFEFCYMYTELPVEMRIGFRYDEAERSEGLNPNISFPINCNNYGTGKQNWVHDFEYRTLTYPLIEDKVMRPGVMKYWEQNKDVSFPEDTGCQNCFWKHPQQLKLNHDRSEAGRGIITWSHVQELMEDRRFKKDISMNAIIDLGIQMDFFGGTGPGCQAGVCGI
jgi:hypothetical protein